MCKFFAHGFKCPDLIEFKACAWQHDEIVKEAHEIKTNDMGLTDA